MYRARPSHLNPHHLRQLDLARATMSSGNFSELHHATMVDGRTACPFFTLATRCFLAKI
jgi:hypothetical protein